MEGKKQAKKWPLAMQFSKFTCWVDRWRRGSRGSENRRAQTLFVEFPLFTPMLFPSSYAKILVILAIELSSLCSGWGHLNKLSAVPVVVLGREFWMNFMDNSATLRPIVGKRNASTMNFVYRFVFVLFVFREMSPVNQTNRSNVKIFIETET